MFLALTTLWCLLLGHADFGVRDSAHMRLEQRLREAKSKALGDMVDSLVATAEQAIDPERRWRARYILDSYPWHDPLEVLPPPEEEK